MYHINFFLILKVLQKFYKIIPTVSQSIPKVSKMYQKKKPKVSKRYQKISKKYASSYTQDLSNCKCCTIDYDKRTNWLTDWQTGRPTNPPTDWPTYKNWKAITWPVPTGSGKKVNRKFTKKNYASLISFASLYIDGVLLLWSIL